MNFSRACCMESPQKTFAGFGWSWPCHINFSLSLAPRLLLEWSKTLIFFFSITQSCMISKPSCTVVFTHVVRVQFMEVTLCFSLVKGTMTEGGFCCLSGVHVVGRPFHGGIKSVTLQTRTIDVKIWHSRLSSENNWSLILRNMEWCHCLLWVSDVPFGERASHTVRMGTSGLQKPCSSLLRREEKDG